MSSHSRWYSDFLTNKEATTIQSLYCTASFCIEQNSYFVNLILMSTPFNINISWKNMGIGANNSITLLASENAARFLKPMVFARRVGGIHMPSSVLVKKSYWEHRFQGFAVIVNQTLYDTTIRIGVWALCNQAVPQWYVQLGENGGTGVAYQTHWGSGGDINTIWFYNFDPCKQRRVD